MHEESVVDVPGSSTTSCAVHEESMMGDVIGVGIVVYPRQTVVVNMMGNPVFVDQIRLATHIANLVTHVHTLHTRFRDGTCP